MKNICGETPSGRSITKEWFDHTENILQTQARLAGLIGHTSSTGTTRERFLANALENILPLSVHLGTGIIIGTKGEKSKQIDIVVYDPRFPVLGSALGSALYFVEGVIASIEVKSFLNKKTLKEALDNCLSVMQIEPISTSTNDFCAFGGHLRPRTYVFAYTALKGGAKCICQVVNEWYQEKRVLGSMDTDLLPSMIVGGKSIGILEGHGLRLKPREQELRDKQLMMGFWNTSHQFGILLSHILDAVTWRLGLYKALSGGLCDYLPLVEYFDELGKDYDTFYLCSD